MIPISCRLANFRVKKHWLLALECDEHSAYYATGGAVHVGGRLWRGIMTVASLPVASVDYKGGGCAVVTSTVRIAPERDEPTVLTSLRPCDHFVWRTAHKKFVRARLYRWAAGDPWSCAQLIIDGQAGEVVVARDGTITAVIEDFTAVFSRRRLMRDFINKHTFAAVTDEMLVGQSYPVIFGAITGADAPVVDVASQRLLLAAAGKTGRLGAPYLATLYRDDTGSAVATSADARSDEEGNGVFTYDVGDVGGIEADEHFVWDGNGYLDTSAGRYTAVKSALITNPADQIFALAVEFAAISEARIDRASFRALRKELRAWSTTLIHPAGDVGSFFATVGPTLEVTRGFVGHERGKLRAGRFDFRRKPVLWIAPGVTMLDRLEPDVTDRASDTASAIKFSYGWGWDAARKEFRYRRALALNHKRFRPLMENCRAGADVLEVSAPSIQEPSTARLALASLAELYRSARKIERVVLDGASHGLELGDVIGMTDPLYPAANGLGCIGKRFVATEVEYGLMGNTVTMLECVP